MALTYKKGVLSEEHKKRISGALKKYYSTHKGTMAGKKHPEETIAKMRESAKRNPHAFKRGHKPAITGKHLTEEQKEYLSRINSGENHPQWAGGKSKLRDRVMQSRHYKKWRHDVFERDGYTCQECGFKTGKGMGHRDLHAHHIKPYCLFPELIFNLDNGITLCDPCHKQTESWGKSMSRLLKMGEEWR